MSKDCNRYKNPEERRKYKREWKRDWRKRNKDKVKQYRKKYLESEKGQKSGQRYLRKLRMDVLYYYGGNPPKCACCGENEYKFLTIDHINNDGAEHRRNIGLTRHSGTAFYRWLRKNNFPKGFQVLCYNCNCGRARSKANICPHQAKANSQL